MTQELALRGGDPKDEHSTGRAAGALKHMIVSGERLPGQAVRRESMAGQLGISRLPVREGLRQLEAERLFDYVANADYVIIKLRQEEFRQACLMRHVLEVEHVLGLPRPDARQMSKLEALCTAIADVGAQLNLTRLQLLNHPFHSKISAMSGPDRHSPRTPAEPTRAPAEREPYDQVTDH